MAKKNQTGTTAHGANPAAIEISNRLDALLHTIRCIAQHEDELCTLLHDARSSGRIDEALRDELQAVLQQLPTDDYTTDLRALELVLEVPAGEMEAAA